MVKFCANKTDADPIPPQRFSTDRPKHSRSSLCVGGFHEEFVLALFVLHFLFCRCFGKAVLYNCGIS